MDECINDQVLLSGKPGTRDDVVTVLKGIVEYVIYKVGNGRFVEMTNLHDSLRDVWSTGFPGRSHEA